jgi:hypothetical protein
LKKFFDNIDHPAYCDLVMGNSNITPTTSVADLIQMLANAATTGATCGGHTKARMNNLFFEEYKEELESSGGVVPSMDALYKIGEFNGKGAW